MKESRKLEFKAEVTNTFLKTVSAYANYGDGKILFGVDDEGQIIGISDVKKTCQDIENRINDSISPRPDYILEADESSGMIILSVREGKFKPYLYKAKAYKRNDTATVEVTYSELTQLILDGRNLTYDELPSENQNLHFHFLQKQLAETLGIENFSDDILRTLGLYTKDHRLNNAAALLADENSFPGMDMARMGKNINYILDRKTVDRSSVLIQYAEAVSLYRQYYQYEVVEGIQRKRVEKVPENAFREAIANALVHRCWDIPAHIRVIMLEEQIEIVSPGGLPDGVSKEDYLSSKVSVLRNPILGDVFFRMHYIERFGTGIRRILDSYAESSRKPTFDISETTIRVVLPVLGNDQLSPDQQKVYDLISDGRLISSSEAAEETGFGKSKATQILKWLAQNGFADVVGRGRGTRYRKK